MLDLAPYCPAAWHGGLQTAPDWWRTPGGLLDPAGIHWLLRRAQLPREELLHMGWRKSELTEDRVRGFKGAETAPRLGRIVLDQHEVIWTGEPMQIDLADEIGWHVVRQWFVLMLRTI